MSNPQIEREDNAASQPLLGSADSLLGICESIGRDVGFNPFYLRIALLAVLVVSPLTMLGLYAGLGVIVAVSRWLFPDVRAAEIENESAPQAANEEAVEDELPIAA